MVATLPLACTEPGMVWHGVIKYTTLGWHRAWMLGTTDEHTTYPSQYACHAMTHCAVLCHAMLCHMPCCVHPMLFHAVPCCAMGRAVPYAITCHAICHNMLCYMPCCAILCHMPCCALLCAMKCYAIFHTMLCYMPCCVICHDML